MVGAIDRPRNHTRDANMRKLQRACLRWGYQWTALVSKDRHRDKVEARQIMMKYLREQGWAYSEIGAILGGRAPTSWIMIGISVPSITNF